MEKFLRPERFDAVPNTIGSDKSWLHWKRTFTSFIASVRASNSDIDWLEVLINYVSPSIFEFISECGNYDTAINMLETLLYQGIKYLYDI